PATSQPPPVVAAPPLDGTYIIQFDNGGYSPSYAFRSTCTSTGCVAAGKILYTESAAPGTPDYVVHWGNGRWQSDPRIQQLSCDSIPGNGPEGHYTSTETLSLEPQPGGSYRGAFVSTVQYRVHTGNECVAPGTTRSMFTASRTGPPPPGIVPDPPTGR